MTTTFYCARGSGAGSTGSIPASVDFAIGDLVTFVYANPPDDLILSGFPSWVTETFSGLVGNELIITVEVTGDPGTDDLTWSVAWDEPMTGSDVYTWTKTCEFDDWELVDTVVLTSAWGSPPRIGFGDCSDARLYPSTPVDVDVSGYRQYRVLTSEATVVTNLAVGVCGVGPTGGEVRPAGRVISMESWNTAFQTGYKRRCDTGPRVGSVVTLGVGIPGYLSTTSVSFSVYGRNPLPPDPKPDDGGDGGGADPGGEDPEIGYPIGGVSGVQIDISDNLVTDCAVFGILPQGVLGSQVNDNVVRNCTIGIVCLYNVRSQIATNTIENSGQESLVVEASSDILVLGNSSGNPSLENASTYAHLKIVESSRCSFVANRTLRSGTECLAAIVVDAESDENAIAFNDFRHITYVADDTIVDEGTNTQIHWNLPQEPLEDQVIAIVEPLIPGIRELHEHAWNENHSGECNGVKQTFATVNEYAAETVQVFLNGLAQLPGRDFTEDGYDEITLTTAPEAGDDLVIHYEVA